MCEVISQAPPVRLRPHRGRSARGGPMDWRRYLEIMVDGLRAR